MPWRSKVPCKHGRCGGLVTPPERYCPEHKPLHNNDYPRNHPERQEIYHTAQWANLRRMFLAEHPLCAYYAECHNPATVVHHIVDHENDSAKMWACDNLQALCNHCHARLRGWNNARKRPL